MKPINLHILDGTQPKSPAPAKNRVRGVAPKCPVWLDADAKVEWKRIAPQLAKLGLICKLDQTALATFCQTFAEYKLAVLTLQQEGRYTVSKAGLVHQHPANAVAAAALAYIRTACGEFGLSPLARSRLRMPNSLPEKHDDLD